MGSCKKHETRSNRPSIYFYHRSPSLPLSLSLSLSLSLHCSIYFSPRSLFARDELLAMRATMGWFKSMPKSATCKVSQLDGLGRICMLIRAYTHEHTQTHACWHSYTREDGRRPGEMVYLWQFCAERSVKIIPRRSPPQFSFGIPCK